MTLIVSGILSGAFAKGADAQAMQRVLWHLREQKERIEKTNPSPQNTSGADNAVDLAVTIITAEQYDALQIEIDVFQQATVEALIAQERLIESTREALAETLDQAYILENGQRVFKDRAGQAVYEEDGTKLDTSVIAPDQIPDHHPRIEDVLELRQQLEDLESEQAELLDYQERLDNTQNRLDRGDITQKEFEGLREQLRQTAPQAVRNLAQEQGVEFGDEIDAPTEDSSLTIDSELDLDDAMASMPSPAVGARDFEL